ncbi:polyphosphate polymerase domain-containing protein [Bacteroidales bacterium OttesenSCG-928-M11]|nr:polyphosphate polymerase domain-containing protein [Bacteroidales bacterium OttesenSCG-928-M11]
MESTIRPIIDTMKPITLQEMKCIRLMDRIDSKFVAPVSILPELLKEMSPFFKVQINDIGNRIAPYSTQYFDTPDLGMFVMHQNGKLNRQKIRIRTYIDVSQSHLEVKNKNNKGRTKKVRVSIDDSHVKSVQDLKEKKSFLDEHSLFNSNTLVPSLANEFKRITLVNNRATERITIDLDLSFHNYLTNETRSLGDLVIIELKQDGMQHSDFLDILMNFRIKKMSFSKYCMGTVVTNPQIKYNRFKRRWALINKQILLLTNNK